eukprot:gb/GFBE01017829.1/.p1 GENE.gb/GFBE01017829.1/~~gb/GFBE01017829.1/.p1  ORF type:complete len:241 (+),score=40.46 gb/GFBE01017829.1/:1-723(+)
MELPTAFLAVNPGLGARLVQPSMPARSVASAAARAPGPSVAGSSWGLAAALCAASAMAARALRPHRSGRASAASRRAAKPSDTEAVRCGTCGAFEQPRRTALAGAASAVSLLFPRTAFAQATPQTLGEDADYCMDCKGTQFLQCYRCKGTGQMTGLEDVSKVSDCMECEATGRKPCGFCFATGLPQTKLRPYLRDAKFKKVVARNQKKKADKEGMEEVRKNIKAAIEDLEARRAAKLRTA